METNENQMRMRFVPDCIEVRESQDGTESRTIQGRAIVFGQETTLWDGKYYRDREIIERSCVTPEFLREQDVKLNALHDRSATVARNNKGVGTLKMEVRQDGVYFNVEMPKCDIGDRILALVRNKTYTGCSFEFWPLEYSEEKSTLPDGREDTLYRHTKFKSLNALTIAIDPAYPTTSVSERERFEKREQERDQQAREAEEAAKKTEAEEEAKREAEARAAEEAENMKQREMAAQRRRSQRRHMTNNFNQL